MKKLNLKKKIVANLSEVKGMNKIVGGWKPEISELCVPYQPSIEIDCPESVYMCRTTDDPGCYTDRCAPITDF